MDSIDIHTPESFPAPWVEVKYISKLFGMSWSGARCAISGRRFPVPTYKVGKLRVVDRDVLAAYFAQKKAQGMLELKTPKKQPARR